MGNDWRLAGRWTVSPGGGLEEAGAPATEGGGARQPECLGRGVLGKVLIDPRCERRSRRWLMAWRAGGWVPPPVWRLQWGKIVERCAATPTRVLAIKVWLVFIWFTFISDYAPGPVPNPLDLAVIQQASRQPASKQRGIYTDDK